jgi:hypothetical protein
MKTIEQVETFILLKMEHFRNIREANIDDKCTVRVYSTLRNYFYEILDFIDSEDK